MEKILQNIVKIIIVGIIYEANVSCNRRFLPPLPYYQNDPYYVPGFVAPYQEYVPVYIEPDIPPPPLPPPVSYENANPYARQPPSQSEEYQTPPQLFYKDENYHSLPPPGVNYPVAPFPSRPHRYKASPYTAQQKLSYDMSRKQNMRDTKRPQPERQKVQVYTSNIIVKDETYSPYYHDEYNKNYQEDDYTDNYTDETPVQKDPCPMNSPYRNFEPSSASYHPNGGDKYTLCNPYFQPNFGNSVYTVKAPITLLPSRFPPRVEEFVQRIQNYFSTYSEKETPKPENQTTTTVAPLTVDASDETSTENQIQVENVMETNATKIQSLEPSHVGNQTNETDKVTIELEFEGKKTPPTNVHESPREEEVFTATEKSQSPVESQTVPVTEENTTPETTTSTAESPGTELKTEVQNDATPTNEVTLEVTDTNG